MNLYEKLNRLDDSRSLYESDGREYCIVAKTFDGKTKFYKDGAFIDDYKSCTTFNDLDDARSEWFDVDKTKYKRVFVPVYDPEAFAKVVTECNESVDDMDRRCEKCNTLLNDGGTCPKCDDGEEDYGDMDEALDPEDVARNHGYRQDDLKDTFDIGDRVAHRWADEYNVGTIKDKRENEGIQYKVEWDYSEGDKIEWLYGDEITHWIDVADMNEELSNREKLERAYPELNLKEKLTEGFSTEADWEELDSAETMDDERNWQPLRLWKKKTENKYVIIIGDNYPWEGYANMEFDNKAAAKYEFGSYLNEPYYNTDDEDEYDDDINW